MSSTDWSLTNWSQVEAGFIGAVRLGILVCRDLKARFRYTESGIVKSVANCLSLSRCTNTIFTCIGEAHMQNLVEIGVIVNVSIPTISSFRLRCSSIDTVRTETSKFVRYRCRLVDLNIIFAKLNCGITPIWRHIARKNARLMLHLATRNSRTETHGTNEKAAARCQKRKRGFIDTQWSIGCQQNVDGRTMGAICREWYFAYSNA